MEKCTHIGMKAVDDCQCKDCVRRRTMNGMTVEDTVFFDELFPKNDPIWAGQPSEVEMVNSPISPMDTANAAKYKYENVGCPACNTIQARGPINCEKCFAPLPVRTA